jgi:RHS repeat-associated protein
MPELLTSFEYDADQKRVFKTSPATGTTFYAGSLYERRSNAAGDLTHVFYVAGDGRRVAQLVWQEQNGAVTNKDVNYLHDDLRGSIDVVSDADGSPSHRVEDPWGKEQFVPGIPRLPTAVTRGFAGLEGDSETGLVNANGRLYDPSTKRFLTPDALVANPLSGQAFNRYTYALNNPQTLFERTGLSPQDANTVSSPSAPIFDPNAVCSAPQGQPSSTPAASGGPSGSPSPVSPSTSGAFGSDGHPAGGADAMNQPAPGSDPSGGSKGDSYIIGPSDAGVIVGSSDGGAPVPEPENEGAAPVSPSADTGASAPSSADGSNGFPKSLEQTLRDVGIDPSANPVLLEQETASGEVRYTLINANDIQPVLEQVPLEMSLGPANDDRPDTIDPWDGIVGPPVPEPEPPEPCEPCHEPPPETKPPEIEFD